MRLTFSRLKQVLQGTTGPVCLVNIHPQMWSNSMEIIIVGRLSRTQTSSCWPVWIFDFHEPRFSGFKLLDLWKRRPLGKHWFVQWLLSLEKVNPISQAKVFGLGPRQAWAGMLVPTLSSPITLGKLLNSLNLSFLTWKVGMIRGAYIPVLSWALIEKMLVKLWKKKSLRYNKSSISKSYYYDDGGHQQKKWIL